MFLSPQSSLSFEYKIQTFPFCTFNLFGFCSLMFLRRGVVWVLKMPCTEKQPKALHGLQHKSLTGGFQSLTWVTAAQPVCCGAGAWAQCGATLWRVTALQDRPDKGPGNIGQYYCLAAPEPRPLPSPTRKVAHSSLLHMGSGEEAWKAL